MKESLDCLKADALEPIALSEKQDETQQGYLPGPASVSEAEPEHGSLLLAATYFGVVLFYVVYFFRPEDFIPAFHAWPLAKITGLFSGAVVIATIASGQLCLNKEKKVLLTLFVYLCFCIPFSTWPGGSFELIIGDFSKAVLISIATMLATTTAGRLRCLMLLQTAAMLMLCVLALTQEKVAGRMFGPGKLFGDPNDFALGLCIVLPFGVAMLLSSHRRLAKLAWTGAIGLILLGIVFTYSRGGFLALMAVMFAMWRRFRMLTRHVAIVFLLVSTFIGVAVLAVGPSSYFKRLTTIMDAKADETGSAQAREGLFAKSLELSLMRPIFGVGPGQFLQFSGCWHQTHNTYTQLSSEAGIPSLALFLCLLWVTFKKLAVANQKPFGSETWHLAGAVYCGMVAYVVGAFFLSTAYLIYPYLLVAYGSAAANLTADASLSGQKTTPRTTPVWEDVSA